MAIHLFAPAAAWLISASAAFHGAMWNDLPAAAQQAVSQAASHVAALASDHRAGASPVPHGERDTCIFACSDELRAEYERLGIEPVPSSTTANEPAPFATEPEDAAEFATVAPAADRSGNLASLDAARDAIRGYGDSVAAAFVRAKTWINDIHTQRPAMDAAATMSDAERAEAADAVYSWFERSPAAEGHNPEESPARTETAAHETVAEAEVAVVEAPEPSESQPAVTAEVPATSTDAATSVAENPAPATDASPAVEAAPADEAAPSADAFRPAARAAAMALERLGHAALRLAGQLHGLADHPAAE